MHHETKNRPMLPVLYLPNHGQPKGPTKRRVYIIHRPLNSPGRSSTAAVCAVKYTAHRPPTKKRAFQYCCFTSCPTKLIGCPLGHNSPAPWDIDSRCGPDHLSTLVSQFSANLGHAVYSNESSNLGVPNK